MPTNIDRERAGESSAVTELHSGVPPPSHEMHEAARRSSGRATSSQGTSTLIHAATSRQAPPVKAASPVRTFFDPWNSSSTGHQRAENRLSGSTSWRASRNLKLGAQYKGGLGGGGGRVADTVGAGSEHFGQDGTKPNGGWEEGARGLRTGGRQSLTELWSATKAGKKPAREKHHEQPGLETEEEAVARHTRERSGQDEDTDSSRQDDTTPPNKQIFAGLCFYINGSTAPLVSDHKLKHMLAAYGARHSIALGRRSVTHVVLGSANVHGGAGGGLAATKIQTEISKSGGNSVKFITVEWVLDSIKANRRLPELRFSPLKLAPKNQNSVLGMMRPGPSTTTKPGAARHYRPSDHR